MYKLGQLIITGVSGLTLTPDEESFIESNSIGGVILFSKNFEGPAQLAELTNSIQELRQDVPMFISVDQEGGRVVRFKSGFTVFPPMMKIAKYDSPKMVFELHQIVAKELVACGINLNFAPCCDVLTNASNVVIGDRAFGDKEKDVTKFVSAAIRGLQAGGVLTCAKHFPGHGSTSVDSHKDLPKISRTLDLLREVDLPPFNKAVRSRVDFIMMGHLIIDSIDKENPASLSKPAHDVLLNELRFKKLIISDDMQMNAITDHYGLKESAILALNAGTDILLYRDVEYAKQALEAVEAAVQSKMLEPEQIRKKLEKISELKKENLSNYTPVLVTKIGEVVGCKEHKDFLASIAD